MYDGFTVDVNLWDDFIVAYNGQMRAFAIIHHDIEDSFKFCGGLLPKDGNTLQPVFELIKEFAATPINERTEPKKYNFPIFKDKDGTMRYLSMYDDNPYFGEEEDAMTLTLPEIDFQNPNFTFDLDALKHEITA